LRRFAFSIKDFRVVGDTGERTDERTIVLRDIRPFGYAMIDAGLEKM
jgi:hypothetical protein